MLKTIKSIFVAATVASLVACGGGGSGTSTPAPVASTSAFNLLAAYKSQVSTTSSNSFSISGTVNGVAVTGTGTATNGAMSAGTFEGVSALQRTTSILGSINANNVIIPLASSSQSWTDSNYIPMGNSGGSEYIVINSVPTLPTAAHVNDTGVTYTATRYTNSTKVGLVGTLTVTYVVEADTASTALVTLISVYKNTGGTTTQTATSQMRVTTTNTFTRVRETLVDTVNNMNLALVY